jgi:hypothetical protein
MSVADSNDFCPDSDPDPDPNKLLTKVYGRILLQITVCSTTFLYEIK